MRREGPPIEVPGPGNTAIAKQKPDPPFDRKGSQVCPIVEDLDDYGIPFENILKICKRKKYYKKIIRV